MISVPYNQRARQAVGTFLILLALLSPATRTFVIAQTAAVDSAAAPAPETRKGLFRLERTPVAGEAELLTVFGSLNGLQSNTVQGKEVPLVSILRDTLEDNNPENDRLRYVWVLTYTHLSVRQRLAASVPFLYNRVSNKKQAKHDAPPPVIDLAGTEKEVWQHFFWTAVQSILLDPYSFSVKATTRAYRRNSDDYRKAHVIRALAILSLYEAQRGAEPVFSPSEMQEIQARLMLTQTSFGGIIDDYYLGRVYQNQTTQWLDTRGHNWELLRQRAEAEGLYFEPLQLPDGSATHALLWIARSDLEGNQNRRFSARFLNIANPWRDARLRQWQGYTEMRYFDAESRPVSPGTTGARGVELIPLALYGLDHPKIPILLVDFRSGINPKQREMSRRVLQDVARNLLAISHYGSLHYFLGRTVYDFVTDRRGMDINQPSRLRAYSQLKLLFALSESLNPQLRDEVNRRLEQVSLNPLENDLAAETKLARAQYAALMAYATRADGLPAKLDRDRRTESVPLTHGRAEQVLFRLANILTFGAYTHREKMAPESLHLKLDIERRLAHHRRFLREVAKSGPLIEVVWNIEDVRRSLQFIIENSSRADTKTAITAALIFARTKDEATRKLCLDCLSRVNNETAKNELRRISRDPQIDVRWRELSAEYLRNPWREEQRAAPSDDNTTSSVIGQ